MIRFNLRLLLRNKILWAWPVIVLIVGILVGIYGDIQSAGTNYSFLMSFGDSPPLPSGFLITNILWLFILIAVIGVPSHFSKNIKAERSSLILSKPVNRTDFFFAEFAASMSVITFFTIISVIILAVLLAFEASIFPFQLYLAILLYIPLYFFTIYVSIVLLLIFTRSYLFSVIAGYLLIPAISRFLFGIELFFKIIGWNSEILAKLADVLSYLIPSPSGVEQLMADFNPGGPANAEAGNSSLGQILDQATSGVLYDGFAAFDWSLFGFVLVSCLPFFLLSYFLMMRKEF